MSMWEHEFSNMIDVAPLGDCLLSKLEAYRNFIFNNISDWAFYFVLLLPVLIH